MEQGGLRGRRSTRHEEREIDKAHVLQRGWESLAGSKYGGTQLSPPNCRDNATDGFDRNPYPPWSSHSRILLRLPSAYPPAHSLYIAAIFSSLPFPLISLLCSVFLASFLSRASSAPIRSYITRLHVFDFISQTSVPLRAARTSGFHPGPLSRHPWSLTYFAPRDERDCLLFSAWIFWMMCKDADQIIPSFIIKNNQSFIESSTPSLLHQCQLILIMV